MSEHAERQILVIGDDDAVVATARDSATLHAANRLRAVGDTDVLVRVNDPATLPAFADLGVETVCAGTELGETLAKQYTKLVD